MYSISALDMVSNLGFVFGTSSNNSNEAGLVVGEIAVGELTSLERAVKESKSNYEKVVLAQATVDGVKVDGIDTNLAVMKELLFPMRELGNCILSLVYWDDPVKSFMFCLVFSYIICRGWLGYTFALLLIFIAVFMVLTRFCGQGPVDDVKDGNIVLLKIRALLLCIFPQASDKFAVALLVTALILAFLPKRWMRRLREWWFSIPAAPVALEREKEEKKRK
ncbi:hypothetical protein CMV_011051 [Castanea mollissima]|uniref:Uncharacterized protein n=1 Tax=Castanea mollissima TaxID=60419 RepID=A0A8J4RBK7_9ROSI|nr:hypothetical protein CMV_011051 [Castanea mollissima]